MASREYSARLGTLSGEQLQAALDRFDLGRLVSAEPLTNGLFGQNLMLETTDGAYVFRGAPHWNPAGEDDWQFPKERYFSRLAHESPDGPPVPWPYLVDEGRDIFGWGFAIQPRVSGAPPTQPMQQHYSAADIAEMSYELGRTLGALHTVNLPAAGTYDVRRDAIRPLAGPYSEYIASAIIPLLESAASYSPATPAADIDWARGVIDSGRDALDMEFQPSVVHLDYGFHNVLFEHDTGAWRITAVIDWMTAEAGHPECDLARPLATDHQYHIGARADFLAGYRSLQPELAGFRERFRVFMLWERALIWEYWQRHNGFKEGLRMRNWMEPFVSMLDEAATAP